MQLEIDVKCTQINFVGHGLFGFGDFAHFSFAFKTAKFFFWTMDYSPMGGQIIEPAQKIYAIRD